MIHDMIELEKMGRPAVAIVSGRFESDAVASSRAFGMPDLQWVVVPRIYRNLEPELCKSQTDRITDATWHSDNGRIVESCWRPGRRPV